MKKVLTLICIFVITSFAAVDLCTPIGWATRSGRTGNFFEITGGGTSVPIIVKTFEDLQKYAKDSSPRVIYIDGTLGNGWSGTIGDRLNITGSNKTIIGLKPGTILKAPIHISKASNIIIRNIVIEGPGSNADQAWDNLTIENDGSKNIWIDHCEFWDGQDGNADVVKGADNVTFTWCIFGYKKKSTHNLSNLIGSSDNEPISEGKLNVTYMFNWWKSANQRKPRCRYGNVHVVNNLLTGDASITNGTTVLGVSAGHMCRVRTERNVFINESQPIYTGNANGTGVNEVIDNIFTNCTGNTKGTGTSFTPPYEYSSFMLNVSEVEAAVKAGAGAILSDPTSCYGNEAIEPPPPTQEKMYQVNKGEISNAFIENTNSGFHGDAYVNFDKGGFVIVKVNVDVSGEYKLDIDFANGSNENRSLLIGVENEMFSVDFAQTGGWNIWETKTIQVKLVAGENFVKFSTLEGMDGPNLDQFDAILEKPDDIPAKKDSSNKDTISTDILNKDTTITDTTKNESIDDKKTSILISQNFDVNLYEVSFFNIKGKLVRKINNVKNEKIHNLNEISRGLPAGIYLIQKTSAGKSFNSFIIVH